ncbi:uncharacterized protein LOC144153146 [Haemaphysalis longicornis]
MRHPSSSGSLKSQVWGNYNFAYDEKHTSGGSWRKESGDAFGNTIGSYGLTDVDGRVRIVNYVADKYGFRASISSNEPGVMPSRPAGVGINAPPRPPHYGDAAGAEIAAAATSPVAASARARAPAAVPPVTKVSLTAASAIPYAAAFTGVPAPSIAFAAAPSPKF